MRKFYGQVRAAATERAMLESLGVEVAPLRTEDGESFYVAVSEAAHPRLTELANDFPARLHARTPDLDGPLSVVLLGPEDRAAERAFLDFRAAQGGPAPAWHAIQREALAFKGVRWRPGLSEAKVAEVLAAQDEGVNAAVGCYATLDALADKVRSSRHWARGEIFTFALDDTRFVVMKQIAPSSCEMLTLTHHGYHDVLTAYRFAQQELVETLRGYLQVQPEPALRYAQAPGTALNGYVIGHRAKLYRSGMGEATIVGVREDAGKTLVALQFDTPQRTDAPALTPFTHLDIEGTALAATWMLQPQAAAGAIAPDGRMAPVVPDEPPYRNGILLLHGTTVAFTDDAGQTRTGRVANAYTVNDRAAGRPIDVRTGPFLPSDPSANTTTVSERAISAIVERSGWSADYARTPREARIATVAAMRFRAHWDATFTLPGERVVDAANFSAAAGYSDADRRAIAALAVGQEWVCPDNGRAHTVRRLPDAGLSLDPAHMAVIAEEFVDRPGVASAIDAPAAPDAAPCAHDYQPTAFGGWRCQYCSQEGANPGESRPYDDLSP